MSKRNGSVAQLGILGEVFAEKSSLRDLDPVIAMIIAVAYARARGEVWITVSRYEFEKRTKEWIVTQDIKVWNQRPTCADTRRKQPSATQNPGAIICQGDGNRHVEIDQYFEEFKCTEYNVGCGDYQMYQLLKK